MPNNYQEIPKWIKYPVQEKRTMALRNITVIGSWNFTELCSKFFWNSWVHHTTKVVVWVSKAQNGSILTIFFYSSNEIFYSNSLPYKRYIFDKYFVKFLLKNIDNAVIGTSSPVTLQKKVLLA